MAETHRTETFFRSDSWVIDGKTHYADWTPFDLSEAEISWTLTNAAGTVVLTKTRADAIILGDPAEGRLRFLIAEAETDLPPGDYTDRLRLRTPALRSTQWYGTIKVRE